MDEEKSADLESKPGCLQIVRLIKIGFFAVWFVGFFGIFGFFIIEAGVSKKTKVKVARFFQSSEEQTLEEMSRRERSEGMIAQGEEMVYIPQGKFYIDKYEVTLAQFRACVEAGGCKPPLGGGQCNWDKRERTWHWIKEEWYDHPINCVSWDAAETYCRWAGKRLPTAAEWEAAAAGTDGRKYTWGNVAPGAGGLLRGNFRDESWFEWEYDSDVHPRDSWIKKYNDGWPFTSPVGFYSDGTSTYGAFDMAGNVHEWVADDHESPEGLAKLMRGSSWDTYKPDNLQIPGRYFSKPGNAFAHHGFRCAKDG